MPELSRIFWLIPIREREIRYALELAGIVRDERGAVGYGGARDQGVRRTDRLTFLFEGNAQLCGMVGG